MNTNYYAALTKRDRIRIDGVNYPIWQFLEVQPDGWLVSLAYPLPPLPSKVNLIVDCGAWTYRDKQEPEIGNNLVTPEWAFERYMAIGGSPIVVAPDHMLIEGQDIYYRHQLNHSYAKKFLELTQNTSLKPMAVAHGMDINERLAYTDFLVKVGYKHIALGGLAARKSDKSGNIEFVREVRQRWPDVYLHVLGLSSEDYCRNWVELGVNSFDGASHYKRGIASGYFYESDGVTYHKAAKKPDLIDIPQCSCKTCRLLREHGIDTRSFGNGNRNIGRAAHNLNILIKRHRWHTKKVVVLVSCVGEKLIGSHQAKDLYQSTWFKKARLYAESIGDEWYILSAKHGVIVPSFIIGNYDLTLNNQSKEYRVTWGREVMEFIYNNTHPSTHKLVFLAGKRYREFVVPEIIDCGNDVEIPMQGLGIGQQLRWLEDNLE